jgi:hypothetical protein
LDWSHIEDQFADRTPKNPRDWRNRWLKATVEVISTGYQGAKVIGEPSGIILHPSPRAIKPKTAGFLV